MAKHLTWGNFETGIICQGEERMHAVSTDPWASIFADRGGTRLGMLVETPTGELPVHLTRLLRLEIKHIKFQEKNCLKVVCNDQQLFREAYLLFTTVVDRTLETAVSASDILGEELAALEALSEAPGLLSVEKQIGLFGELYVLRDLLGRYGITAFQTWTGPMGEPHDFRIQNIEIEVKTTVGRRRIHRIHGLMQGVASANHNLFFLSIMLGPAGAGAGESLPSIVSDISSSLSSSIEMVKNFSSFLQAAGYSNDDIASYGRTWILRAPPIFVPVDQEFPAITSEVLQGSLGSLMARVEQVEYEVNLEGMGREWLSSDPEMPKTI